MDNVNDRERQRLVLALVETCVRNTFLETLHAGRFPDSQSGDYQDVKVVTPDGEIPWPCLSRISDEEMKALMVEVVNRVFTFLTAPEDLLILGAANRWDAPQHDSQLWRTVQRRALMRAGMSMEAAFEAFPLVEEVAPDPALEERLTFGHPPAAGTLRRLAYEAEVAPDWVRRAREALLVVANRLDE